MSYIIIDGPEEFTSIVVSLWFRVPQISIDKARAQWAAIQSALDGGIVDPPPMAGIVPLLQFGDTIKRVRSKSVERSVPRTTTDFEWNHSTCGWDNLGTNTVDVTGPRFFEPDLSEKLNNRDYGFIGVDCRTDRTLFNYLFYCNQGDDPTVEGLVLQEFDAPMDPLQNYHNAFWTPPGPGSCNPDKCTFTNPPLPPIDYVCPQMNANLTLKFRDDTSLFTNTELFPECFAGVATGVDLPGTDVPLDSDIGIDVTGDHWHHVALCLNIKKVQTKGIITSDSDPPVDAGSIDSASEIFIALDDTNYQGRKASFFQKKSADDNSILTATGWSVFENVQRPTPEPIVIDDLGGHTITTIVDGTPVQAKYSYTPKPISITPINIPGNSDTTFNVEMAKLQIFTDVLMDTSVPDNLRVFVTDKGKPASLSKAEEFFGKKPEVLLDNVSDWKKAINRGTLNPDINQGVVISTIDSYTPSPNLFGDQGKPN